jgi:flavodoxin
MKIAIVYFSKFGNTRRLAEVMGEAMKPAGEVRVVGIDQVGPGDFEGAGLVVVGTPTHGFNMPPEVRAVLDKLPAGMLAGKLVAAFDTTARQWPLRVLRASPKLLRRLQELEGRPIVGPETFFVRARNPQTSGEIDLLHEGQIDRARQWAAGILDGFK